MNKERFRASVQYGDLTGTVAADRSDGVGADEWLESRGHKGAGEFVLGIEVYVGENAGKHSDPITVHFLLVDGGFDSAEAAVKGSTEVAAKRRVSVDMDAAEFLGLFKRFSINMSPQGILTDKKYSYPD